MREIPIFIASSVREFRQGRLELSPFLEMLNKVYKRMDAQLVWNRPETSSRVMNDGGSQLVFDDFIRKSEFFALIVGKSVGTYTRHEYEIALEQFRKTGKPKILPCFLADASPEAQAFRAELQNAPIGVQFIDPYENFDAVKNQLQFEIANYVVETAPQSDAETDFNRARERIRDKIRALQAEIKRLQDAPASPETIAEITLNYAEIWRLVREYKVEPDLLLDYMEFLYQQRHYDTGVEVGHWLEGFYKMENPGDYTLSRLQNLLGLCYVDSNRYEQAKRHYQEASAIIRRLAENSPKYQSDVAAICNNLGELFRVTNHMEEAEAYYREALEIYKRLANENPSGFDPNVTHTYANLAILLSNTNRMEEAEAHLLEALKILRRLAKANPSAFESDLAHIYHHLGTLLSDMNRTKETEQYYRKALKIRLRLVKSNPSAFEPGVAETYNNLGNLYATIDQMKKAEQYYRKALKIYGHLAKENPDAFESYLATAHGNLGNLLRLISRMKEAETHLRKALEIRRRLAEAHPDAYLPDVAQTCYNLGIFERDRNNCDAARRYFWEALSIFEKFPHLAKEAQMCRDRLAELQDA